MPYFTDKATFQLTQIYFKIPFLKPVCKIFQNNLGKRDNINKLRLTKRFSFSHMLVLKQGKILQLFKKYTEENYFLLCLSHGLGNTFLH